MDGGIDEGAEEDDDEPAEPSVRSVVTKIGESNKEDKELMQKRAAMGENWKRNNRTVILVTHIVSDVEYIANQVILMDEGSVVCKGKIEDLEKSIEGKVWKITRENTQSMDDLDFAKVSNLKREREYTSLRVVSDELPAKDATKVDAGLEDVFLYYCGGDERCED